MKFSKKGQTKFSWRRISQSEIQIQRQQKDRKRKVRASRNPPPIPFLFVYLIGQSELFASGRQNQIKKRKNSRPCPTQPDARATKSRTPLVFVAKN